MSGLTPGSEDVSGAGKAQCHQSEGSMMHQGHRGITVASIDIKTFRDMVNTLPSAESPVDPEYILIDSGSDISLVWNQDMFTCMKPCSLQLM